MASCVSVVGLTRMRCVFVRAHPQDVTFLYKFVPGVALSSFGMNVARLAGLPLTLITQAAALAHRFEHAMSVAMAAPAVQRRELVLALRATVEAMRVLESRHAQLTATHAARDAGSAPSVAVAAVRHHLSQCKQRLLRLQAHARVLLQE